MLYKEELNVIFKALIPLWDVGIFRNPELVKDAGVEIFFNYIILSRKRKLLYLFFVVIDRLECALGVLDAEGSGAACLRTHAGLWVRWAVGA